MKVFLSHRSVDKDLARRLARDLQAANIDVWLDQWEIRVGEEFAHSIDRGVDDSDFVIVLLTQASTKDAYWVEYEWNRKKQDEARTKRIAVIPVRGEPCEIPDFLAQRSHADISGGSYPLGFRYLLQILQHYSGEGGIEVAESSTGEEDSSSTMVPLVTPIALEVGRDLIPIFEPDTKGANRFLDEVAPAFRDNLQAEFGFTFPGIRVRGNETYMPPCSALIMIDEVPEVMIEMDLDDVLVDATVERLGQFGIKGKPREDPIIGHVLAQIATADRATAAAEGFITFDMAEYLFYALYVIVRQMAPLFLDIDLTHDLVDAVKNTAPDLVESTVPKVISWFELTDVLQRLVAEQINIGDIELILETLSQYDPNVHDTILMTEEVRHALRKQITAKFIQDKDSLQVLLLDSEIETLISGSIQRISGGSYLAIDPQHTVDILDAIRTQVTSLDQNATGVVILVSVVEVRCYIRKLVELEFPLLHVLSRQDLEPNIKIQTIARIRVEPLPPVKD